MRLIVVIIAFITFIFGIILGAVIKDIPLLKINPEVRLFEPLSFVLTALIGLLIPFFIKKWIDDNRFIKNNLVSELRDTLKEVERISDKIKFCHKQKSITKADKDEINGLFEIADLKYNCLTEQFKESYDQETSAIRTEIYEEYISYWKFVTGAELMSSKFRSINDQFFSKHNELFIAFETKLKKCINQVHKL